MKHYFTSSRAHKTGGRITNPDQDIEDRLMEIFGETKDGFDLGNVDNVAINAVEKERHRRCSIVCASVCYLVATILIVVAILAAFAVKKEQESLNTIPKIEKYIKSLSSSSGDNDEVFSGNDTSSPQSKALKWIIEGHIKEIILEAEEEAEKENNEESDDKEIMIVVNDNIIESKEILRQRYVLAVLYYSLNGDNWNTNDNWLSTAATVCDWYSSSSDKNNICSDDGLLQILHLENNNLQGTLPTTELQHLFKNQLLVFAIRNNTVSGTIPKELFEKTKLEKLVLSHNDLDGTIPTLDNAHLQLLSLESNPNLIGGISNETCNNDHNLMITMDCAPSAVACNYCPNYCHCCSEQDPC